MNYEGAGYIYAITNRVNGKKYIGSTVCAPTLRRNTHLSRLRRGTHHSYKLQSGWNAFGEHNFEFRVLFVCPADMTLFYENLFLPVANYNILGAGETLAHRRWAGHTKKVRQRVDRSAVIKRSWENPTHRASRIAGLRAALESPETRAKYKKASTGRRHSAETKAVIASKKYKHVFCPTLGVTFFSGITAAEFFGVCRGAISNALRLGTKIAGKYELRESL